MRLLGNENLFDLFQSKELLTCNACEIQSKYLEDGKLGLLLPFFFETKTNYKQIKHLLLTLNSMSLKRSGKLKD